MQLYAFMCCTETSLKYSEKSGPFNPDLARASMMRDEELCRLVEQIDERLHELCEIWMASFRESRFVTDFLFTEEEEQAWYGSEPNFPKRIVNRIE